MRIASFALAACLVFSIAASSSAQEGAGVLPSERGGPWVAVLCYHHVDCSVRTDYSVTSEQLSGQVAALRSAGFSFIDAAALEAFYENGAPIPEKSVLITFDDGDKDVYDHGFPLLRKLGLPFAFFVYPNAVNAGHKRGCVSWDDLKEMAAAGVAIGSHSMSHPFLTSPPPRIADEAAYDAWLDAEISGSKSEIEAKLGRPVTQFAIPFGAVDSRIRDKIAKAGYALSYNVHGACADIRSDRLNVNRIIVLGSMSPQALVALASAPPLYFKDSSPRDLSRVETERVDVSFSLDDAAAYDEPSLQSRVGAYAGLELRHIREGDRFAESVDLRRPSIYGVHVTAKDKRGRLCRGMWLFIYDSRRPPFLSARNGSSLAGAESR